MLRDEIVAQTDLVDAITEALKRKGVYSAIKSKLRAEVFHTLEDKTVIAPSKPRDVFLASELIREFLMKFKLDNSNSVFSEEFGQPPAMQIDRQFVAGELGLNPQGTDESMPLLIQIIQMLIENKAEHLERANDSVVVETGTDTITGDVTVKDEAPEC